MASDGTRSGEDPGGPASAPGPTRPELDLLRSPLEFLGAVGAPGREVGWLRDYQSWLNDRGQEISDAVDRAGTPWIRMFDRFGGRVDELLYPGDFRELVESGYRAGLLWRSFEASTLLPGFRGIHVTSFWDPGLSCPYTVSLATAVALSKYAPAELKERYLPPLLRRDGSVWQGATWMTEIKGGSDLGANVETVACPVGDHWLLRGDKYFASNAGAEVAVVAARREGAPPGVRGLSLFLVPRRLEDGRLNYVLRRLKDKIATRSVPTAEVELRDSRAWLLGAPDQGIYVILEVLNLSRVANSLACAALAQRAMADALSFAEGRMLFGRLLIDQPLMRRQFGERLTQVRAASGLAWEAARLLEEVWQEKPPYSDRFHLFRLVAHLAKYWTAEVAAGVAKWGMEVHGGLGVLGEHRAERWLREAMILAIWEGGAHRQILDGLEVMGRKRAHVLLLRHLLPGAPAEALREWEARIERHLGLPEGEREAGAETLFFDLASFVARALVRA